MSNPDAAAETRLREALGPVLDHDLPIALRQRMLTGLREEHPDLSVRFDAALLERDQWLHKGIADLEEQICEMRTVAERLTSGALPEAVFVGPSTHEILGQNRRLARVVTHGARELLVTALDDEIFDTLRCGDRVLLAADANVLVARLDAGAAGAGDLARVESWLDDARLVLRRQGDQTMVVRAAATLGPKDTAQGDWVRVDPLSGFAVERVEPVAESPYAAEDAATDVPPEALAGYDDIRDAIRRRIAYGLAHPELAARYGLANRRPWVLLGGPPGCGKSTLARVLAGDLQRLTGRQCRVRRLNGGQLQSPYVGETEARIEAFMKEATRDDAWSLVFIDEVDAIARTRGAAGNVHADRFLNTWLAFLDGFGGRASCILVAASNRLDTLDPAFRSRFATEITMQRPGRDAAQAIFARHLPVELPYSPGGDAAAARARLIDCALARLYLPNAPGALLATLRFRDGKTRGVHARDLISGRLIEQICCDARERALGREIEGGAPGLCIEDIDEALELARDRLRVTLTPSNAHAQLTDLSPDLAVVEVEPAPRLRSGPTLIREAA